MSRILLLAPELHGIGGVERLVASLSGLLVENHDVHVASFDPPGTVPGVPLAVPFHALGGDAARPLPLRPLTYAAQVRRLRAVERRLGIDVTISNLWRADLISALAGRGVRRVALAHTNVVGNAANRLMLRLRPVVARVYRRFDRFVAVSGAVARELTKLYRLDPVRVATIWNPVAPPALVPPAAAGERIIWCGRMAPEKNLLALVDAFAALRLRRPAAGLEMIGDGPERGPVEARAAAHGLSVGPPGSGAAIILHGRLDDPARVIAGASALALPSRAEGFGLVLVEAMVQGVAVAAADCPSGGVHEVLGATTPHDPARVLPEEVPSGWLLPVPTDAGHSAQWAEALDLILADPARHRVGALARGAVFAPARAAAAWNRLLAEITR